MNPYFYPAEIVLPREPVTSKWSVVACDQYTSDEGYWNTTSDIVGTAASTLHLVFPERYLNRTDREDRIRHINETMLEYEKSVLTALPCGYIYVERTLSNGKVRRGLMGCIDLEQYDFRKGSKTPIRATEGTVLERIPPRVKIRENASLELPHVMLLFDDSTDAMFKQLQRQKSQMKCVYDFELMQNGGHIIGYYLSDSAVIDENVAVLAKGTDPLVFAVGDGNHSLATAKQCYVNMKASGRFTEEQLASHPARFALVELVNIHDTALEFEPIYRVLFHADLTEVLLAMQRYYPEMTVCDSVDPNGGAVADHHSFTVLSGGRKKCICVPHPTSFLPVGTLQAFLDDYLAQHPATEIDYIHGIGETEQLASAPDTVGFLFTGMGKGDLFPTVKQDGALPRKTFSMGEANDKRFYLECRKIR